MAGVQVEPGESVPRVACVNLPGSFLCPAVNQACVAEENFGNCWNAQGGEVTACVDNIAEYRRQAASYDGDEAGWQNFLSTVPVSVCDCAAAGCFEGPGDVCEEACSPDECSPEGTCPATNSALSRSRLPHENTC